ncbi:MAG: hypothetical protein HKN25_11955 [Pyrinomonadaceae bacterium]|nr:hypothetical protein [Pyrinomonadaceae bacterium]
MADKQTYANHVRWLPPYHFFLAPLMLVNLIYWIVRMVQVPSWDHGWMIVLSIGLVALTLLARTQALTAQDRLIRLEERLRYREVLSPDLAEKAMGLRTSEYIALRFASDDELPDLVEKTLNGDFEKPKDIKLAVQNWRGDYLRV